MEMSGTVVASRNETAATRSASTVKTKDKNAPEKCREFAERLVVAMEKAKVSQAELSRIMGVSRSAANWWVQGLTYPSLEKVEQMANLLRTTPEHLLFGAVKVPKERLVDSIPVVARVQGRQTEVTRITIPKEFSERAHLPANEHLRAHSIFGNGHSDIVVADTSDKTLTTKTPKAMVITLDDDVMVAKVSKKRGDPATMVIQLDDKSIELPYKEKHIIGRLAVSISAPHV